MWTAPAKRASTLVLETALSLALAAVCGMGMARWGAAGEPAIIATAAGAVAGGLLGNYFDRLLTISSAAVTEALWRARQAEAFPVNHDLARALWRALLRATLSVAKDAASLELGDRMEGDWTAWNQRYRLETFLKKLRRWVRDELRSLAAWAGEPLEPRPVQMLVEALPGLVNCSSPDARRAINADPVWAEVGRIMLQRLQDAGVGPLPPAFRHVMEGEAIGHGPGFGDAVRAYFLEILKTDQAVYRVCSLELQVRALRLPSLPS